MSRRRPRRVIRSSVNNPFPTSHDEIMVNRLIEDLNRESFTLGEAWAARERAQSVLLNQKLSQYHSLAKKVLERKEIREILLKI